MPGLSGLEFLKKFLGINFALSHAEDNTSGPLNRGGIADLPLLKIIWKSDSFKNTFATITSLSLLLYTQLYGPFMDGVQLPQG